MVIPLKPMNSLDRHGKQNVNNTVSVVVDFLNHRLQKTSVELRDTPCYCYRGKHSKLEVIVFANPGIASIDIRLLGRGDGAKEPYFTHSYDLKSLSFPSFKREIEDMIFKCERPKK